MRINKEKDIQDLSGILSQIKWTGPMGLKKWAMIYDVHPNTMRAWFKKQYIVNKKVSPRMWRVSVDELPVEVVTKSLEI